MTSYEIPFGKHKGKAIDNLSDNILAGLLWAYRPDGLNNEELHGESFAVLYERHGSAKVVVEIVDRFEEWANQQKSRRLSLRLLRISALQSVHQMSYAHSSRLPRRQR
jgi:hypothetical protein